MTFPDFIERISFDMTSERVVVSSESRSKSVLTRSLTGQRFDVQMRCFVRPWNTLRAQGWIESMQRDNVTTTYTDEQWVEQQSSIGNKTTNGARAAGNTTVALTSISGVFVGARLNFAGHSKLYSVVAISGNTITLNTGLLASVAAGSAVNFSNPTVTLELAPELKRSSGVTQGLSRSLGRVNLRLQEVV